MPQQSQSKSQIQHLRQYLLGYTTCKHAYITLLENITGKAEHSAQLIWQSRTLEHTPKVVYANGKKKVTCNAYTWLTGRKLRHVYNSIASSSIYYIKQDKLHGLVSPNSNDRNISINILKN
jgi:hypothetical protein